MSGIDKIIQQIELDSKSVCDSILADARAKADKVIANAKDEALRIAEGGKEASALRVEDIKKRGDSAADLEERRILLNTKQSIISDMLRIGLNEAKNLPDTEYFDLIEGMVGKYSMPENGVICFGRKDFDRLPKDYLSRLNHAAKGELTLDPDAADIDAGFILKYGGIEQNCSFDAIFAGEAETLSDKAGKLLF